MKQLKTSLLHREKTQSESYHVRMKEPNKQRIIHTFNRHLLSTPESEHCAKSKDPGMNKTYALPSRSSQSSTGDKHRKITMNVMDSRIKARLSSYKNMEKSAYLSLGQELWIRDFIGRQYLSWGLKWRKNCQAALASVAQWTECWPANREVAGSIPSQGTCLGCRPGPL